MIGSLRGRVTAIEAGMVLIDVGGVGYEVRMPLADASSMHVGEEATVLTSLSVSQDQIALYGFLRAGSRRLYAQLLKVSGIGPKVALSILSTLTPDQLRQAVDAGDVTALSRAPGLGKKGAQKIILELAGKVAVDDAAPSSPARASESEEPAGVRQVTQGLIGLGWQARDAQRAVELVRERNGYGDDIPTDAVATALRQALVALDTGK